MFRIQGAGFKFRALRVWGLMIMFSLCGPLNPEPVECSGFGAGGPL